MIFSVNLYCAVSFINVKKLQKIEFGLVGIQTVGDLIGALFYTINICQLYLQRYFFYCTMDYTTGVKTDDFIFYHSTDDLNYSGN